MSGPTFHLEPAVCLILPSTWSQQSVWSYLPPGAAVCHILPSTWSQQSVWSYLPPGASSLPDATFHLEPAVCLILPSTWSQQSV